MLALWRRGSINSVEESFSFGSVKKEDKKKKKKKYNIENRTSDCSNWNLITVKTLFVHGAVVVHYFMKYSGQHF